MRRIVLTYGLISGIVSMVLMLATVPFIDSMMMSGWGQVIGYTGILLAALLVFFGIRSYRENLGNGKLTFGRGFAVGILITVISCAFYVATWEVLYFGVMPDLGDKLVACMVQKAKTSGDSPQEVEAAVQRAHQFKEAYDQPAINVAWTFVEPFPVGLLVTLVSAAVLRRK